MSITTSGTIITFSDGSTLASNPVPSGSVFVLYQASAPTGWTQVTSLNDYALRIVSGTGGSTGGTTAFSSVFTNQTPSISVNVSGLSAGATTLSTTQIPSHSHQFNYSTNNSPNNGSGPFNLGTTNGCTGLAGLNTTANQYTNAGYSISNTGGGGSHTHSISGSATGSSSAITLNVQYANHILCSKN